MILIPNLLTACNLVSGIAGIFFVFYGRSDVACYLILVSSLFDGVDGKVARWLNRESEFGAYFDSLSDFISFGLAPAGIFFYSCVGAPFLSVSIVCWIYISCCAFRLIRFHRLQKFECDKEQLFFKGLPTTASAVIFVPINLWYASSRHGGLVQAALLLLSSSLMVSNLRFYNPKSLFRNLPQFQK